MIKILSTLFLTIIALVFLVFLVVPVSANGQFKEQGTDGTMLLNEVSANNPGGDISNCEYIEIKGDPSTLIGPGYYLIEVEGDAASAGTVDFAADLNGIEFGSNGLITIAGPGAVPENEESRSKKTFGGTPCGQRDYNTQGTTYIEDSGISLENGSVSFLIVVSPIIAIMPGMDLDTNNDGALDNLPKDASVIDAVGWSDGGSSDLVYGGVDVSTGTTSGAPDSATRDISNDQPLQPIAWFADDLSDFGVDTEIYIQTNLNGGYQNDFLTPGRQNSDQSAASGLTIRGRVTTGSGAGIKHVWVGLTSDTTTQTFYAMTNQFGNYVMEGVNTDFGEPHTLQVLSGRYTFPMDNLPIVANRNIWGADFGGIEIGS